MSQGDTQSFPLVSEADPFGLKLRQIFDETRDLLRLLEADRGSVGHAGRLAGMTRVLNVLEGWPSADHRDRYLPRIQVQVARYNDRVQAAVI